MPPICCQFATKYGFGCSVYNELHFGWDQFVKIIRKGCLGSYSSYSTYFMPNLYSYQHFFLHRINGMEMENLWREGHVSVVRLRE